MAMEISIPGYDRFEQIAVGGMAAVYRARQISIDKTVAIKVLFPYLANDESFIERFQREAKSAAKIQHENIVNVVDFGESDGCYFIVMEYYEGLTLADIVKDHQRVPLDIAATVVLDVCLGLEAAHAVDIVHRDIKPANIIYTHQGGIKVADFGLAKKSDTMTVVTQPGKVLGTPAYMSPEQAAGANVGPQSDIFSLGVVAFELLCHRRPFDGDSFSEVLEKIQTQETPSLINQNPLVQPQFEAIITRMLEKDPARRYASITDVIADLERVMDEFEIRRDRRRLRRYIGDPDGYNRAFTEKMVSKCLSQGAYFMQKGKGHFHDAMLAYKRILYLDPANQRAMKSLAKLREQTSDDTVTVELAAGASPASSASPPRVEGRAPSAAPGGYKRVARTWFVVPLLVVAMAAVFYGGWWAWSYLRAGGVSEASPVVSSPDRVTVSEGDTLEFDLAVAAADSATLRLYGDKLPEGAVLDENGHFTWSVDYAQAGEHRLEFYADDGHNVARAQTVVEVTDKPVELDFAVPGPRRVTVGQTMSVALDATSAVGRDVEFTLAEAPAGMKLTGSRITWVPATPGGYSVTVDGTDGVATASRSFRVDVRPAPASATVTEAASGRLDWVLPKLANVYVDGKIMVREDTYLSVDLPAGRHTVRAELLDGLTVFEQVVDVVAGERTSIEPPRLAFGKLSVYFLGGVGELVLNGDAFAQQPPFTGVVVPVGTYHAKCAMFKEGDNREFEIKVSEGHETVVEYIVGREPTVTIK